MKKALTLFMGILIATASLLPMYALADDSASIAEVPTLTAISFKNATIDNEFSPYAYEYDITLDDTSVTPTLENYSINGEANIFVTYITDEAKHQTGISVTLQFDNGSTIYNFTYSNAKYTETSNNLLESVDCSLGEVYPAINDKDTEYKLYIPSDLTEIKISATTQEVNAICEAPGSITLNADQEPSFTIIVTASNGEVRVYTFKVKRLNKTSNQVKAMMQEEDFESIVDGELFYQKPEFRAILISIALGIAIIIICIAAVKRITIKVSDDDEVDFFDAE